MYQLHCTKKLLDRVKSPVLTTSEDSSALMGAWYATALFWKPQLALLVNERTLLPILMPLAPATDLGLRFPQYLSRILEAHGISLSFIEYELLQMQQVQYAKTANRSVVGVMNQFVFLAERYRESGEADDPLALSLHLSETPCSPLYKSTISPKSELRRLVGDWSMPNSSK